jgi:hypothetical protein
VKAENVKHHKHHSTAVRMTCVGIALMSVLVLCKMNADIHLCGNDLSILQQLPVIAGSYTLAFGFLSMLRHKFRKPYRPTPTLEADNIPPLPINTDGVLVLIFKDRIKTFPKYYSVQEMEREDSAEGPEAEDMPSQADAVSPPALDAMAVKKKIMGTVEPTDQFEEAVMLDKDAVLMVAVHFVFKGALAAMGLPHLRGRYAPGDEEQLRGAVQRELPGRAAASHRKRHRFALAPRRAASAGTRLQEH